MKVKEFLKLILILEVVVIFALLITLLVSLITGMETAPYIGTRIVIILTMPFPAALFTLLIAKRVD